MRKTTLFIIALLISLPMASSARMWVELPQKQGAEGDPEDGNHSPIQVDPKYMEVDLSVLGVVWGYEDLIVGARLSNSNHIAVHGLNSFQRVVKHKRVSK